MEVKLSQRADLRLLLLQSKPNFPSHSFDFKSWANNGRFFQKQLRSRLQKWRFQIEEMSKGQCSAKHYMVHVVKEGETLSSISKQYGVSVYAIVAANKNLVDVDLVFKDQHLNIPSVARDTHLTERRWSPNFKLPEKYQGGLKILIGQLDQKNFRVLYSPLAPYARTSGFFLVLVPLIAFCIRCIIGAFHARISGKFRLQATDESDVKPHRSRGGRWKSALIDTMEPDMLDAESIPDSTNHAEDQAQISLEDASHDYKKLEHDYNKFLSECGISKWGYWRDGSPT
ncbi:hypothetical protein UlMin_036046 [Ulmus minor]